MILPVDFIESRIAKLLKDSYIAASAAEIAREDGNEKEAKRLRQKSGNLYNLAVKLDPNQDAKAWQD